MCQLFLDAELSFLFLFFFFLFHSGCFVQLRILQSEGIPISFQWRGNLSVSNSAYIRLLFLLTHHSVEETQGAESGRAKGKMKGWHWLNNHRSARALTEPGCTNVMGCSAAEPLWWFTAECVAVIVERSAKCSAKSGANFPKHNLNC